jgi:hypothetical protein
MKIVRTGLLVVSMLALSGVVWAQDHSNSVDGIDVIVKRKTTPPPDAPITDGRFHFDGAAGTGPAAAAENPKDIGKSPPTRPSNPVPEAALTNKDIGKSPPTRPSNPVPESANAGGSPPTGPGNPPQQKKAYYSLSNIKNNSPTVNGGTGSDSTTGAVGGTMAQRAVAQKGVSGNITDEQVADQSTSTQRKAVTTKGISGSVADNPPAALQAKGANDPIGGVIVGLGSKPNPAGKPH